MENIRWNEKNEFLPNDEQSGIIHIRTHHSVHIIMYNMYGIAQGVELVTTNLSTAVEKRCLQLISRQFGHDGMVKMWPN